MTKQSVKISMKSKNIKIFQNKINSQSGIVLLYVVLVVLVVAGVMLIGYIYESSVKQFIKDKLTGKVKQQQISLLEKAKQQAQNQSIQQPKSNIKKQDLLNIEDRPTFRDFKGMEFSEDYQAILVKGRNGYLLYDNETTTSFIIDRRKYKSIIFPKKWEKNVLRSMSDNASAIIFAAEHKNDENFDIFVHNPMLDKKFKIGTYKNIDEHSFSIFPNGKMLAIAHGHKEMLVIDLKLRNNYTYALKSQPTNMQIHNNTLAFIANNTDIVIFRNNAFKKMHSFDNKILDFGVDSNQLPTLTLSKDGNLVATKSMSESDHMELNLFSRDKRELTQTYTVNFSDYLPETPIEISEDANKLITQLGSGLFLYDDGNVLLDEKCESSSEFYFLNNNLFYNCLTKNKDLELNILINNKTKKVTKNQYGSINGYSNINNNGDIAVAMSTDKKSATQNLFFVSSTQFHNLGQYNFDMNNTAIIPLYLNKNEIFTIVDGTKIIKITLDVK